MTHSILFYLGGFSVIMVGLYGVLTQKNVFRLILSLGLMETGVNILIVATGYRAGTAAPILKHIVSRVEALSYADPLPQALVLTSIVIGFGVTALALALAIKYKEETGTLDMGAIKNDKEEVSE